MNAPWEDERIAANGEPVRDNFARWFDGSKITDGEGRPLVVYHGSGSNNIQAFRQLKEADGVGWFARDPALASTFAEEASGRPTLYPVYLSIQNPLDTRGGLPENIRLALLHSARSTAQVLLELGYDGLISDEWGGKLGDAGTTYLAFRSDQVKSAIGNAGLYLLDNVSLTDLEAARKLEQAHMAKQSVIGSPSDGVKP